MAKKLRITQTGSTASRPQTQEKTLKALGLGRIGKVSEVADSEAIRGQIFKVKHLIKVEEI